MPSKDYEEFQQRIFDELEELEHAQGDRVIIDFIRRGHQVGIDVVAEMGKGKSAQEVIDAVRNLESPRPK
jgi:hypothetical protein